MLPEEKAVMAGRRSSSYDSPFFFFFSFFLQMDPSNNRASVLRF